MIGRFFDDCCTLTPEHQTQASALYQAFKNWYEGNGEKGYAANKFGAMISKEKQLDRIRTRIDKKSCYVWKGIGLLSDLEYSQETSFNSMTCPLKLSHRNDFRRSAGIGELEFPAGKNIFVTYRTGAEL